MFIFYRFNKLNIITYIYIIYINYIIIFFITPIELLNKSLNEYSLLIIEYISCLLSNDNIKKSFDDFSDALFVLSSELI